jgi:hypothetical protein
MKQIVRASAILIVAILALSCEVIVPPAITSFRVLASENGSVAGLSGDVTGIIDEAAKTIEVRMPAAVASYAGIKPSIVATDGATVSPNPASVQDFSASPFPYVVENSLGEQVVYSVQFKPAVTYAAANAVQISEVYCGAGTYYKGDWNKWIELTNTSASAVDLSQYDLAYRVWEEGARKPERDIVVPLRGTLPAGASLVIYSSRINATTFSAVTGLAAPDLKSSDITYNYMCEFDGDDGLQLLRDGTVLDSVGPAGGCGNGMEFMAHKRFLRKNGRSPASTYDEKDWIVYTIQQTSADAGNVGAITPATGASEKALTFIGLESLEPNEYGIINEAAGTVSIGVPSGTDVTNLPLSFSTTGAVVRQGSLILSSGVSRFDFSSPVVITVFGTDASSKNYTITVVEYDDLTYTTTNYAFPANPGDAGSIQTAITAMEAVSAQTVVVLTGYLEGILTAKNVLYKYGTTTYSTCFFIQDKNAAVMVWTPNSIDYPLGSRIRVYATQGVINYSMKTIIAHGVIERRDPYIYPIYYKTGTWNDDSDVAFVFGWSGTVLLSADGYNEGYFTQTPDIRMYQVTDSMTAWVKAAVTGSFYGPILVSYSKYKMCLSERTQVR